MKRLLLVACLAITVSAYAVEDQTSSTIDQALSDKSLAVVEVYRPGCPMCVKMIPIVRLFEEANSQVPIYRISFDDKAFQEKYPIPGTPAFLVFKQGKLSHVFFGLIDNDSFYQSVFFSTTDGVFTLAPPGQCCSGTKHS